MGTGFSISKDTYTGRVNILNYRVPLPYRTMFRMTRLFKAINKRIIKKILRSITGNQPFDLVIDFGLFFLYDDLTWVNARKKIFFPVDDFVDLPVNYKGANLVFSVSENILAKFRQSNIPAHFIHHGLSGEYAAFAGKKLQQPGLGIKATGAGGLKIGYVGNLDNEFVDHALFLRIIKEFPQQEFHIYGPAPGTWNKKAAGFGKELLSMNNVHFHGRQTPLALAEKIQEMDILLLCYMPDYKKYYAENSHKIMEYLSTGKPIVSTYISVYENTDLLCMSPKDQNEAIIPLLRKVTMQSGLYNSREAVRKRITFALDHTYARHATEVLRMAALAE